MHTKKQPQMLPPRMQRRRPPACFRNKNRINEKVHALLQTKIDALSNGRNGY